jgi:antitoxin MazE
MKIPVIKIGNSKGIRLSKTILEKYEIKDAVEMVLEKDTILLKPITPPRKGWEIAFSANQDDSPEEQLIDDIFEDETLEEWK